MYSSVTCIYLAPGNRRVLRTYDGKGSTYSSLHLLMLLLVLQNTQPNARLEYKLYSTPDLTCPWNRYLSNDV